MKMNTIQLKERKKRQHLKNYGAVFIVVLLCVSSVHSVAKDEIISAIPNEDEIFQFPLLEQRYWVKESTIGLATQDFFLKSDGYVPITCLNTDHRIKSLKGDYFQIIIHIFLYAPHRSGFDDPDVYREKRLLMGGKNQNNQLYPKLPGGVISEREIDTNDGHQTNNICKIYAWVDSDVEIQVNVWGQTKNWVDEYGCTPSSKERLIQMRDLVKSEAVRISDLLYKRLTGTDTIPPDTELVNKKEIAQDRLRYARDIRDDYEKHWNNVVLKEVTGGVFGDVNLFDAQYSASNPLKIPTLDDTLKGSFLTLDERA